MFKKQLLYWFAFLLSGLLINVYPVQAASKNKIIYIPLDDRPVSAEYVVNTMNAYGEKLLLPPAELLATRDHAGNPDKLMKWFLKNAKESNIAVISTDSLIYGGLVASRTHQYKVDKLLANVRTLRDDVKKINPELKVYAYSTIMRTPSRSMEPFEPYYYEQYGSYIFRFTQLVDKKDMARGVLDTADSIEKKNMQELIPTEHFNDWFTRRYKNMMVHNFLLEAYARGAFHYYTIGKDDSAPLSQTHLEARKIQQYKEYLQNTQKSNKFTSEWSNSLDNFRVLPGVDQVGMVLLARAMSEQKDVKPKIYVEYADKVGSETISIYSDQPIYSSVVSQIEALGGELAVTPDTADFTFMVYTPENGISRESVNSYNSYFPNLHSQKFATRLQQLANNSNKIVLADVAFVNGATNGLMSYLDRNNLLGGLLAYSGWNTVDNSIGYALAQGTLSLNATLNAREKLLKTRLLDDWIYQSNVRFDVINNYVGLERSHQYHLKEQSKTYEEIVSQKMHEAVTKTYFLATTEFNSKLPWKRMFDISITIP